MKTPLKIVILLLVIGGAIYTVLTSKDPLEAYQERPLPPQVLRGLDGKDVSTAKWALETDGPKVINFFASWCPPCLKELPELQQLSQHVPVYGIASREDPEKLKEWLAQHGNPYKEVGIDKGLTFLWDLGISALPTTLVLDASQKIVYIQEGAITAEDIERRILPRLQQLKDK